MGKKMYNQELREGLNMKKTHTTRTKCYSEKQTCVDTIKRT